MGLLETNLFGPLDFLLGILFPTSVLQYPAPPIPIKTKTYIFGNNKVYQLLSI